MLKINKISVEGLATNCVTDKKNPMFNYTVESDRKNINVVAHRCLVFLDDKLIWDSNNLACDKIQSFLYDGDALKPLSKYRVQINVEDNEGNQAKSETTFETGRLDIPWCAQWITDKDYRFLVFSPKPMSFRKKIGISKEIDSAKVMVTAFGVVELDLNGEKIGNDYFCPGFTSYEKQLQYQSYDITDLLKKDNVLIATVTGGWAVGDYTMLHKNRIYADRQALLMEIWINYKDGTSEVIKTDSSWEVTVKGNWKYADFYMGENYDSRIDINQVKYKKASITIPRHNPKIIAQYGVSVKRHEKLVPVNAWKSKTGSTIYDFGQNFAGIISFKLNGKEGQKLIIKHAEICVDNELYTKPLRLAKARIVYICKEGMQQYSPRFTYMGFRYVSVEGVLPEELEICAYALYSDIATNGNFACSNDDLNQLQNNIVWSGKSNFVELPTDCPQRDERMGWTGDIAVFASTATFNFDMQRFLDKWLLDVIAEQAEDGGIPDVVPRAKYGKTRTVSCWADSCVLVPWAMYLTYGDKELLKRQYESMKKHVDAELQMAAEGMKEDVAEKYIWRKGFHYGDWCAPNETRKQWQEKAPWVATAFMSNSCQLLAKVAYELNNVEDEKRYSDLAQKINQAYLETHMDTTGKLYKEFQTGYVLPLYFKMADEAKRIEMAKHLSDLVKKAGNHLQTGFCGTPYLLFALSDNGQLDTAYDLLLQDLCPSWLYEVKTGATTIWERWDALRPDGTINHSGHMVSFNHYAYGAVGDFLYRRVAGIEALEPGYKNFKIKPMPGGNLTWAKASLITGFGKIISDWQITDRFTISVEVPVNTSCTLELPDGTSQVLGSGSYKFSCSI